MAVVPQASMRSTQRRVQGLTLSSFELRNLFQPSSTVKSNFFAGRGGYMRRIIAPQGGAGIIVPVITVISPVVGVLVPGGESHR